MITAILGDSFGGHTWLAVSSYFVTQVKGTAMAVAGPRMLSVAIGEEISNEELGGWQVHAEHTGQVDSFVEDEESALKAVRSEDTRLNSSHVAISYAVFCLKKKKRIIH